MDITQTGLVLFTENYEDCVAFYGDMLDLPVIFEEAQGDFRLTCFGFGTSYLLVETGGVASDGPKTAAQSPMKLRFNVSDIEAEVAKLTAKGLKTTVERHPWGSVAQFTDPDGNWCALKEEDGAYRPR